MKCNKPDCKDDRATHRELKLAYDSLREKYWTRQSLKECGYCEKDMIGHWDTCEMFRPTLKGCGKCLKTSKEHGVGCHWHIKRDNGECNAL